MRKAISLFLAASVLCLATSALATPTTGTVTGMKNSTSSMPTDTESSMPCFRPGDTIGFTISNLTNGEELTLITYKNTESTLSDSNVQYINQYTVDGNQAVNYTIRDQASGIYKLVISGAQSGKQTFYYKVGKATVSVLGGDGRGRNGTYSFSDGTFTDGTSNTVYGNPYIIKQASDGKWSVGFVGKVTVDSGEISISDIAAHPGFTVKESSKEATYGYGQDRQKTVAQLETTLGEINGAYSFVYGLTMYNVLDGHQNSIQAKAVLDAPIN